MMTKTELDTLKGSIDLIDLAGGKRYVNIR